MKVRSLLVVLALLAGCRGGWLGFGTSERKIPSTPPGAKAYACEDKKRLFVRYAEGDKSAWVIYPDREFRLDRVPSASGEQFTNGNTTLALKEGEALLQEGSQVLFAGCKLEKAS